MKQNTHTHAQGAAEGPLLLRVSRLDDTQEEKVRGRIYEEVHSEDGWSHTYCCTQQQHKHTYCCCHFFISTVVTRRRRRRGERRRGKKKKMKRKKRKTKKRKMKKGR